MHHYYFYYYHDVDDNIMFIKCCNLCTSICVRVSDIKIIEMSSTIEWYQLLWSKILIFC